MKNYFIVHGSFSNPSGNWFGWLTKYIAEHGLGSVYTPSFPVGVGNQNYENWSALLNVYAKLGLINADTTIIAHSIAPVFVSKFLVQNSIKVDKLVFVCGFNNYFGISPDFDEVNRTMYFDKIDRVKNFANEIVCYYSDNDPYVKFESERDFANQVSTKQYLIKGAGHINAESGFDTFEEILKEL